MEDVESYYDQHAGSEWQRLARHRTEYATTRMAMDRYLPSKSRILDVGGGPGRYAIDLALSGHRVVLLDLSRLNLDLAREKAGEANADLEILVQGNALDLGEFADKSFDAVLCLGPLYHLTSPCDRSRAISEALRVLVPGGLLFAAFITCYAPIRDVAKNAPSVLEQRPESVRRWLNDGITDGGEGFTSAHFTHPFDVRPLMESFDMETLRIAGAEGAVSMIDDQINGASGQLWDMWVDLNYRLGEDPCLWGASEHLLYVGRKAP